MAWWASTMANHCLGVQARKGLRAKSFRLRVRMAFTGRNAG